MAAVNTHIRWLRLGFKCRCRCGLLWCLVIKAKSQGHSAISKITCSMQSYSHSQSSYNHQCNFRQWQAQLWTQPSVLELWVIDKVLMQQANITNLWKVYVALTGTGHYLCDYGLVQKHHTCIYCVNSLTDKLVITCTLSQHYLDTDNSYYAIAVLSIRVIIVCPPSTNSQPLL